MAALAPSVLSGPAACGKLLFSVLNETSSNVAFAAELCAQVTMPETGRAATTTQHIAASARFVLLACNAMLYIFERPELSLVTCIEFDAVIDAVAISVTAADQFALCFDRAGAMHCLALRASNTVLFSQSLGPTAEQEMHQPRFLRAVFNGLASAADGDDVAVLERSGTLYVFSAVAFAALAADESTDALAKLRAGIRIESIAIAQALRACDVVFLPPIDGGEARLALAGATASPGSDGVVLFTRAGDDDALAAVDGLARDTNIVQLTLDASRGLLGAVDASGALYIWDVATLVLLVHWPAAALGAACIAWVPWAPRATLAVLRADRRALSLHALGAGARAAPLYSIDLRAACVTECAFAGSSDALFLCAASADGAVHLALSLREGAPTLRLAALLQKGDFAQAIACARESGLDAELVHKAQAEALLARHETELPDAAVESLLDALRSALRPVSDRAWLVRLALEARVASAQVTAALLLHAQQVSLETDDTASQAATADALARLTSFELITGAEQRFSPALWQRFRSVAPLQLVSLLVSQGRVRSAMLVWRRHVAAHASSADVIALLAHLPHSVPVDSYLDWLESELAPLVAPAERPLFEAWLEERARAVEADDKRPHRALRLVTTAALAEAGAGSSQATWTPGLTVAAFFARLYGLTHRSSALSKLRAQLADLVCLYDKHDLAIALADYARETPSSVAVLMMERVVPDALASEIATHVRPYLARHKLNADKLLGEYLVQWMVAMAVGQTAALSSAASEQRCLVLVASIRDSAERVSATIEFLRRVAIPWSDDVEALMRDSLTWDSPRQAELAEQQRLLRLKRMFVGYGVASYNLSDASLATALLRHIVTHLDSPSALEDGLAVVRAYHHLHVQDAYAFHLQALLRAAQYDRALSVLTGLEADAQLVAGQELLVCLTTQLRWAAQKRLGCAFGTHGEAGLLSFGRDVTALLCATAETAARDALAAASAVSAGPRRVGRAGDACASGSAVVYLALPELRRRFDALVVLRRDFGLSLDDGAFDRPDELRALVHSQAAHCSATQLQRLASLLGVTRDELDCTLACTAAQEGNVPRAAAIARELLARRSDAPSAERGASVARTLMGFACAHAGTLAADAAHAKIPTRATQLLERALASCSAAALVGLVNEYRCVEMTQAVLALSDAAGDEGTAELGARAAGSPRRYRGGGGGGGEALALDAFADPFAVVLGGAAGASSTATPTLAPASEDALAVPDVGSLAARQHFHEDCLVLAARDAMPAALEVYEALTASGRATHAMPTASTGAGAGSGAGAAQAAGAGAGAAQAAGKGKGAAAVAGLSGADRLRRAVVQLCELLQRNGSNQAALRVRALTGMLRLDDEFAQGACGALLRKVLGSSRVDAPLALGYMLALDLRTAYALYAAGMRAADGDWVRLQVLARLGMEAGALWRQEAFRGDAERMLLNAHWWSQLQLLGITFDCPAFVAAVRRSEHGYLVELLNELLLRTSLDVSVAREFAASYGIADEVPLIEYVRLLLVGPSTVHEAPRAVAEYRDRVAGVAADIAPGNLRTLLANEVLPRLSHYDYDRIKFVLTLLVERCSSLAGPELAADWRRQLEVLGVLAAYSRRAAVSVDDADVWTAREDSALAVVPRAVLESWLRVRLPFFALAPDVAMGAVWPVLKPELDETSIARLVKLAGPLRVDQEDFAVEVIDSMVSRSADLDVDAVLAMLNKIRSNKQTAINVAEYVADALPVGLKREKVLKFASQRASAWAKAEPERKDVAEICERVFDKARLCATLILLNDNGLGEFARLADDPHELVCQLYRCKGAEAFLIERNGGVSNLDFIVDNVPSREADNKLDTEQVRRSLIQAWLTQDEAATASAALASVPAVLAGEAELAVNGDGAGFSPAAIAAEVASLSPVWNTILCVAKMFLYDSDRRHTISYLLNFALNSELKLGSLARAKALQVLFCIASDGEIGDVHVAGPVSELRGFVQVFLYHAQLARLRIPYTVDELRSPNKDGLVRALWRNHRHNPATLGVVAQLCVDHGVHDPRIWDDVLGALLGQAGGAASDELLRLLDYAAGQPALASQPIMQRAWLAVLSDSQAVANGDALVRRLHRCPFLLRMDLAPLVARLAAAGQVDAAAQAALLIAQRGARGRVLRDLATGASAAATRAVLDALAGDDEHGALLRELFAALDERRGYGGLVGAKCFGAFVTWAIANDCIGGLLHASLAAGREADALGLVEHYVRAKPDAPASRALAASGWGEDGTDRLGAVLEVFPSA